MNLFCAIHLPQPFYGEYIMNIIKNYKFGKIMINDSLYQTDLIVFTDHIQENWWRENGHLLTITDLKIVINYKPEVLIIGTGMYGLMRVEEAVISKLKEKGIKKILIEKTKNACEAYNKEISSKKVAALHITC
jgi:hypothetical protein